MVISGHLHQFEYLIFSTQVPAQLILGNGGTKMSKPMPIIPCTAMIHPCTVIDNLRVLNGQAKDKFGYGMIQLENQDTSPADPKSITIRTDEGSTYKTCSLRGYMLRCSSPALPKTLGDLASGLA